MADYATFVDADMKSCYTSDNNLLKTNVPIGGCSNGAYIAAYSILNNPILFAAGFLVCGTYPYYEAARNDDGSYKLSGLFDHGAFKFAYVERTDAAFVTEEQLKDLGETPLWFIVSVDDTTVNPQHFTLPLYPDQRLAFHLQERQGTDMEDTTYFGHFSWINRFNKQQTASPTFSSG